MMHDRRGGVDNYCRLKKDWGPDEADFWCFENAQIEGLDVGPPELPFRYSPAQRNRWRNRSIPIRFM
jgi:hypothetical protein